MIKANLFAFWLLFSSTSAFSSPQLRPRGTVSRWSTKTGEDVSSDAKYSGGRSVEVDMNVYNLPLDQIAQEWSANVVPESSLRKTGIYLGAKSSKVIMADTVKVVIPRRIGEGMGMELLEIAGGREDDLGITVINGIVEGGCADGSDVMVGDSIVQVAVRKIRRDVGGTGTMSDVEEVDSVEVECFGYDKTVEAFGSLPPAESSDEVIVLTLKRLRRKPKVVVTLKYPPYEDVPDTIIELFAGENLRRAMLTRGVPLNDVLSKRFDNGGTGNCGAEGTCGTCVVSVVKGNELLNSIGQQEAQILTKNPRWRFACKAIVGDGYQEGEMTIHVNPRQWDDKRAPSDS